MHVYGIHEDRYQSCKMAPESGVDAQGQGQYDYILWDYHCSCRTKVRGFL